MCGHACAKYTLIVFNVIFWLAGAALLGLSIWALVDPDATNLLDVVGLDNSKQLIRAAAITLCVVGGVIFIMGFIGCCGALRENACLLNTYAAFVIILLLGQIAAGALAVIFKDRILNDLTTLMTNTLTQQYGKAGFEAQTQAFDFLQTQNVPVTCCVLDDKNQSPPVPTDPVRCQMEAAAGNNNASVYFHSTGCYDSMYNWVRSHAVIFMGVAFGLAGIQILMVVLACCVACEVRNKGVLA